MRFWHTPIPPWVSLRCSQERFKMLPAPIAHSSLARMPTLFFSKCVTFASSLNKLLLCVLSHIYCASNKCCACFTISVSLWNSFFKEVKDQGPLAAEIRFTHASVLSGWVDWRLADLEWPPPVWLISAPYASHSPVGYLIFSHMAAELSSMKEQKCRSLLEPRLGTGTHHSLGQSKLKGPIRFRGMGDRYHFLIRGHAKGEIWGEEDCDHLLIYHSYYLLFI